MYYMYYMHTYIYERGKQYYFTNSISHDKGMRVFPNSISPVNRILKSKIFLL